LDAGSRSASASKFADLEAVCPKVTQIRSDREKWMSSLREDHFGKDISLSKFMGEFYIYPL